MERRRARDSSWERQSEAGTGSTFRWCWIRWWNNEASRRQTGRRVFAVGVDDRDGDFSGGGGSSVWAADREPEGVFNAIASAECVPGGAAGIGPDRTGRKYCGVSAAGTIFGQPQRSFKFCGDTGGMGSRVFAGNEFFALRDWKPMYDAGRLRSDHRDERESAGGGKQGEMGALPTSAGWYDADAGFRRQSD